MYNFSLFHLHVLNGIKQKIKKKKKKGLEENMLMTNSFQEKNLKQEASTLKQDLSTQKVKKNTYLTRQNTMCESGG